MPAGEKQMCFPEILETEGEAEVSEDVEMFLVGHLMPRVILVSRCRWNTRYFLVGTMYLGICTLLHKEDNRWATHLYANFLQYPTASFVKPGVDNVWRHSLLQDYSFKACFSATCLCHQRCKQSCATPNGPIKNKSQLISKCILRQTHFRIIRQPLPLKTTLLVDKESESLLGWIENILIAENQWYYEFPLFDWWNPL